MLIESRDNLTAQVTDATFSLIPKASVYLEGNPVAYCRPEPEPEPEKENNNARALTIGLFVFICIGLAIYLIHTLKERRKANEVDEENRFQF